MPVRIPYADNSVLCRLEYSTAAKNGKSEKVLIYNFYGQY